MPYIESVKVYKDGEDVSGGIVYFGDALKIKAIVKNNGGAVQGKVRLLLDNDKTGSPIYDELSTNYSLNSNGNTTEITIDYVPNEEGDIYFNINLQANVSELGGYIVTDGWDWSELKLFNAKEDVGNLSITMQNAEGTSTDFPGLNGKVRLYSGNDLIASDETDENGIANFTGVKSGDYEARFYHVVEGSIHGEEYWGKKPVNITIGELQEYEFVRYMPYIESVKVYREEEDVTGSAVYTGEELKIKAIVKNNGGAVQGKVRLLLDNDKTGSSIYDELSTNYSLKRN